MNEIDNKLEVRGKKKSEWARVDREDFTQGGDNLTGPWGMGSVW